MMVIDFISLVVKLMISLQLCSFIYTLKCIKYIIYNLRKKNKSNQN